MLGLDCVTYTFSGATSPTLKDINIKLEPGHVVSIQGDNASGKTTLSFVMCGAIPDLLGGNLSGSVYWGGNRITGKELQRRCAYAFQNPQHYFVGSTLREEGYFTPENSVILDKIMVDIIREMNGETPLRRLSGGQQQMLAVISALTRTADLVILDEPFGYLDPANAEVVATYIASAKDKGKTIVVMGSTPEAKKFVSSVVSFDQEYLLDAGHLSISDKELTKDKELVQRSVDNMRESGIALEARGISYRYPKNKQTVLKDISFHVHCGESLCIVGNNGSGKTTLLMYLAGLLGDSFLEKAKSLFRSPTDVTIYGLARTSNARRRLVKSAFQNPDAQIFANSVAGELAYGLKRAGISKTEVNQRMRLAEKELPFGLDVEPFLLSFGQRKLLTLMSTFILRPKIIVLDEPLAGLDLQSRSKVQSISTEYLEQGGCLVVAAHDCLTSRCLCHGDYRMGAAARNLNE